MHIRYSQDNPARLPRVLFRTEGHFAADHEASKLRLTRGLRLHRRHDAAGAHYGHTVGDLHHFAQLVRDDDDRLAFGGEASEHREEPVRFLRRQHRRGLVED